MRNLKDMTEDEIISNFIEARGLDPTNDELRKSYPLNLIWRAKRGDASALVELLKIGTDTSPLGKIENIGR